MLQVMWLRLLVVMVMLAGVLSGNPAFSYTLKNDFAPNAFPAKVSDRAFSIALDPGTLMVVYPGAAEQHVAAMRQLLRDKCGADIPFRGADTVTESDLREHDLIVVGNISDNKWALKLYQRRFAFADAYFPGKGGLIVTPLRVHLGQPSERAGHRGEPRRGHSHRFPDFRRASGERVENHGAVPSSGNKSRFPQPAGKCLLDARPYPERALTERHNFLGCTGFHTQPVS